VVVVIVILLLLALNLLPKLFVFDGDAADEYCEFDFEIDGGGGDEEDGDADETVAEHDDACLLLDFCLFR
jgi:hypothetical protein